MGKTHKDSRTAKADRTPRVQQKIRKNNLAQNLTANVDLFFEEEHPDEDKVFWDSEETQQQDNE